MNLQFTASGLLDAGSFDAWRSGLWQSLRGQVAQAMRETGKVMAENVRSEMRTRFKTAKPAFLRSMRSKVFDSKPDRLPALYIGSKVPWLGLHEQGGTIQGRMLIPLLPQHQRLGRKAFARVVRDLMDSGNAFFIQREGRAILMAENLSANSRALTRFRRAERERTGVKRLKRGQEIPIAVFVRRVTLRRRFDLQRTVERDLPQLAAAIQKTASGL
ncbi:DUF6441 family protein [Aquabacterium sp. A7-Y]|uniref:DUF6441 family protein n=1 Tax=Aquabacterium sp. A7-Y TaxID=1349605 RepID=UPI00223CB9D2|nr:DUF6441 family protein [Aquabacterium sp. A7-Y]MCW7540717.1 DUF6441 family protein [Aquabacterium sp. A7-Y]